MNPEIFAHRTGTPQNSWGGLRWCLQNGVRQIECDITFTKDKKPIIWLDDMNHCLNQPKVFIPKLTLKEALKLKRIDCPKEEILTFQDIRYFLTLHPEVKIFFDVKYYFAHDAMGHLKTIPDELVELTIKKVVEPALGVGLKKQIGFITFPGGVKLLEAVKKRCPEITTNLIVIFPWTRCKKHFPYLDAITIGQTHLNKWMWAIAPGCIQRITKGAKKRNVKIHGGFANTESDVFRFLKYGVEGLWTDNIPLVQKILERRKT